MAFAIILHFFLIKTPQNSSLLVVFAVGKTSDPKWQTTDLLGVIWGNLLH
jgi:hypothetical protein